VEKNDAPAVFLSHASADDKLASLLESLLKKALKAKVFRSSEKGAIGAGDEWFSTILTKLLSARVCIAILTPKSAYLTPWVLFEAGGGRLLSKHKPDRWKLVTVRAYGLRAEDAPAPLNPMQIPSLADRQALEKVIDEIAQFLGVTRRRNARLEQAVAKEAGRGSLDWRHVSSALVGARQGTSPFNFDALLKDAQTTVYCAGFNLHHIATSSDALDGLFKWLMAKRARSVRLMISDQVTADGLRKLGIVEAKHYRDFADSIRRFRKWEARSTARGVKASQIQIRTAASVGLTVLAIDPDSDRGQLVLTPTIRPTSPDRPHLWISKALHPTVFHYYWDQYRLLFKDAKQL